LELGAWSLELGAWSLATGSRNCGRHSDVRRAATCREPPSRGSAFCILHSAFARSRRRLEAHRQARADCEQRLLRETRMELGAWSLLLGAWSLEPGARSLAPGSRNYAGHFDVRRAPHAGSLRLAVLHSAFCIRAKPQAPRGSSPGTGRLRAAVAARNQDPGAWSLELGACCLAPGSRNSGRTFRRPARATCREPPSRGSAFCILHSREARRRHEAHRSSSIQAPCNKPQAPSSKLQYPGLLVATGALLAAAAARNCPVLVAGHFDVRRAPHAGSLGLAVLSAFCILHSAFCILHSREALQAHSP
jgi:hypothetical protein